jgi:hypothetical protein
MTSGKSTTTIRTSCCAVRRRSAARFRFPLSLQRAGSGSGKPLKKLARKTLKERAHAYPITAPKIKRLASIATRTPSKLTTKQTQELGASVLRHIEPRGGKVRQGQNRSTLIVALRGVR